MRDEKEIRIKYHADIDKIKAISIGDWIDLRCAENVSMKAGEHKMFSLGVSMELPVGYEALVVPRSSTFSRYHIIQTNHCGVIDESYNGDNDVWHFPAYATEDTFIPKNARVCQFRIIEHQPNIIFKEVETFGNEDRGGLGSTGEK